MMLPEREKGFTLIELMLALTILSVILVIIFGALRMGVQAWEKGEESVEYRGRMRIVLGLMRDQMESVCLEAKAIDGGQPFFLKGDKNSLELLSFKPLTPGRDNDPVYVIYRVDREEDVQRLSFYEINYALGGGLPLMDEPGEKDYIELFSGVNEVSFEYLKEITEDGAVWVSSWEIPYNTGLPRAVRITVRETEEAVPLRVIARMEKGVES